MIRHSAVVAFGLDGGFERFCFRYALKGKKGVADPIIQSASSG